MLPSWEGSSPRGWAGLSSRPGPAGLGTETGLGELWVKQTGGDLCRSHLAHADPAAVPGHGEGHIPQELLIIALRCFTSHRGLIPWAAAHSIPGLWSQAQLFWLPKSCFSPPGLFFGQGSSLWGLYSKLVSSSSPYSQRTSMGCAFPSSCW